MRRLLPAVILVAAACSDSPRVTEAGGSAPRQVVVPNGTLDQNIYTMFLLFPKGQATAGLNRWNTVKKAYEAGLSSPAKMTQAQDQLFRLAEWVKDMTPKMADPPGDDTPSSVASRLVLYMSLYIYDGPATTPPAYSAGADNAIGLVTPSEGTTIVTPSTNAGVSLQAGAVDVNTIVVITENLTPYPANCAGPLPTALCQYPKFYHFSQFPHARLNIAAKFAVCHVNQGTLRTPLAGSDHDEYRLAHNKPANPADYTPGSTIRDTGGESIEILPFTTQTFSICDDIEYALNEPTGLEGFLARGVLALQKLMTPKSAFAIDQGGGGEAFMFSDFNNVDPDGVPDDSVFVPATPVDSVYPGDPVSIAYFVTNVGTATSPTVLAHIGLTPFATTAAPPTDTLTAVGVMPLVPGQQVNMTTTVPLDSATAPGTYTLSVSLGSNPAFPDAQLSNNGGSRTIVVRPWTPVILRTGKKLGGR